MRYTPIDDDTFREQADLANWELSAGRLRRTFACGTFGAAGTFAAAIAAVADEMDHHPDIDVRYPDLVTVASTTHFTHGLTDADLALARAVDNLAATNIKG